ncbi:MAG: LCP family protein [Candidatus Sericytochromatia bacterium]|nr:LCP family protein [Candidatus Sericytochromatia bacterium]
MRLTRPLADTVLVGLAAWCSGCIWGLLPAATPAPRLAVAPRERTLLVAVLDDMRPPGARDLQGHADTLLLLRRGPSGIRVLAIPRDTWLAPLGTKANGATWRLPPRAARLALGRAIGVRIDGHVVLTMESVQRAVDLMGGIEANVPHPLHDADRTAGWEIDLPAGRQHMDGRRAVQWLRYRGQGSDLDRMRRLAALAPQLVRGVPGPSGLLTWARRLAGTWTCDEPVHEWGAWCAAGRRGVTWRTWPGRAGRVGGRWVWLGETEGPGRLLDRETDQSR